MSAVDPRDPLIAASDDLADHIATLALRVAPHDTQDFIIGVCDSAQRLARRAARASGSYRVQPREDGYTIVDPAGQPVDVWYSSEGVAVGAASAMNRERLRPAQTEDEYLESIFTPEDAARDMATAAIFVSPLDALTRWAA